MQPVKYQRATTVAEAVRLLQEGGEYARPLAGGTDVIVQARERRREIDYFVDIKHIPELMHVRHDANGVTIGAAVPCYLIYGDAEIVKTWPALADATHVIGGTAIQGRASLGGNLCNSSPAADSIPAMIALGAVAHIVGPKGERDVPVAEFCTSPGRNVLGVGEFVTAIRFAKPEPGSGAAWQRFIPRNEMDIAVVNAGVYLRLDRNTVRDARVAIGAVAPTPLVVPEAAQALVGKALSDQTIAAAGDAAKAAARPIDDMRGSVKQRRHLSKVLTERMIRRAAERARGQG
ncbi:MAG: xanthine dehydrogenase family protein subunit M [Chloroflexi bacterium]|nr:xanthine dehydrogenase family protein subunit M [Chloroflexota bacterium]